jgi:RimJ/RimL family protein N-acetyltransferase
VNAEDRPPPGEVALRPLVDADWPAVHGWASQEQVCRFQPWGPNTPEETLAFVRAAVADWRAVPRERLSYAITLDGVVVGNCELKLRGGGVGDIGYVLDPAHWGRGIATVAASQLVAIAFREHELHRLAATCDPRNTASTAVLRRLGMTYEGRMREVMLIREGWRDSEIYSLLAHVWPGERRATA